MAQQRKRLQVRCAAETEHCTQGLALFAPQRATSAESNPRKKIQAAHASMTSKPFKLYVWPLHCCRSSGQSLSRPQSLLTTRSHLKPSPGGPVLLNNVPSPQITHGHHSSSRDFFSQPAPGAILTNGAPAGLQKTILELMRRQSDTVKWEQKSSRACEHRSGVASHRLSDAVLL